MINPTEKANRPLSSSSLLKSFIAVLLILCIACMTGIVYSENESSDRILQIDLDSATDDEIAEAIALLVNEQKARIVTKLTLDHTEVTLAKGKTQKLVPEITDLKDGVKVAK